MTRSNEKMSAPGVWPPTWPIGLRPSLTCAFSRLVSLPARWAGTGKRIVPLNLSAKREHALTLINHGMKALPRGRCTAQRHWERWLSIYGTAGLLIATPNITSTKPVKSRMVV